MATIKIPVYWTDFLPGPSTTVLRLGAQQRERTERIYRMKKELESLQEKFAVEEQYLLELVSEEHTKQEVDSANADYTRSIKS